MRLMAGQSARAVDLSESLQLIPLARESVTAHLRKLEREGRARREGEAWHIIEP